MCFRRKTPFEKTNTFTLKQLQTYPTCGMKSLPVDTVGAKFFGQKNADLFNKYENPNTLSILFQLDFTP